MHARAACHQTSSNCVATILVHALGSSCLAASSLLARAALPTNHPLIYLSIADCWEPRDPLTAAAHRWRSSDAWQCAAAVTHRWRSSSTSMEKQHQRSSGHVLHGSSDGAPAARQVRGCSSSAEPTRCTCSRLPVRTPRTRSTLRHVSLPRWNAK